MIRMPISPRHCDSVTLEPDLADSPVSSKYRETLLMLEVSLWIARFNIRACLEKTTLYYIEACTDAFFRIRRLARQATVFNELNVALVFRKLALKASFGFKDDKPFADSLWDPFNHVLVDK